jgi:signal transduction histidine kinase
VLSGLSEITQRREGSLYLAEHERADFRRLAEQGSLYTTSTPPTLAADHPLVYQLARHQQILDRSVCIDATDPHAAHNLQPMLESLCSSIAIPLVNRGRLVAFVLLQSEGAAGGSDPNHMELLTAMAQSAANALDSLLVYEDLRQSQTLMRRTDRLRSLETIAGGFAHEIRNPLTSIKTFIQLAPERMDDAEFIRDFSRIVLDDVYRIERLIEEILDYARYMEPKLTDEDVNEVVLSCLYFIDVKARSREIKIEKELASELPRVMLDRQQIKQVLLNLFLNAMDAIGESGGMLRVRTSRIMKPEGGLWVRIDVEDTGCGIPPANLERIFDPFFTTKHESGENEGTGLGLAITHQIIREHRGDIHVRSAEGVGTTFRIDLPSSV